MNSFMERFTGRKPTPAQSAKDRLKFVLVTDRTAITPEELRKMQMEILDVIRKYCRIKEEAVEMKFEQRDRENYLVADIPLSTARPDEEGNLIRFEATVTFGSTPPADLPPAEAQSAAPSSTAPTPAPATTPPAAPASAESPAPASESQAAPSEAGSESDKVQVTGAPIGLSATSGGEPPAASSEKSE